MPLLSSLLDQPSPPLLAAEAMGDLPARRQGAIGLTVLQSPRPGVQLHLRRRAFISPVLTHNTLVITRSPRLALLTDAAAPDIRPGESEPDLRPLSSRRRAYALCEHCVRPQRSRGTGA